MVVIDEHTGVGNTTIIARSFCNIGNVFAENLGYATASNRCDEHLLIIVVFYVLDSTV